MAETFAARMELMRFGTYVYMKQAALRGQIESGRMDVALAKEVLALFDDFTDRLERRGAAADLNLAGANRRYTATIRELLRVAGCE